MHMMHNSIDSSLILLLLAPIFLILFFFEVFYYYKKDAQVYSLKDTLANITLSLIFQIFDIMCTIFFIKIAYAWIYTHGFQLFPNLTWYAVVLLFIAQDFLYYWFHRAAHRVRWIWASHVAHHSSTHLNFSTAFRQSMTYQISGMWIFWLPLAYIGFTPDDVLLIVGLNLAFQFFIHTQMVGKLGFIEYMFNTPSHHRAHHGKNSQYIDKNYGGTLIIWDKLFGTFVNEDEAPIYGITRQINSYNPFVILFNEWTAMFKDAIQDKTLKHFWMPPNWTDTDSCPFNKHK